MVFSQKPWRCTVFSFDLLDSKRVSTQHQPYTCQVGGEAKSMADIDMAIQGRNCGKILAVTSAMVGKNLPPFGWDRVKVSENLGATAVAPVTPAVTSRLFKNAFVFICVETAAYPFWASGLILMTCLNFHLYVQPSNALENHFANPWLFL